MRYFLLFALLCACGPDSPGDSDAGSGSSSGDPTDAVTLGTTGVPTSGEPTSGEPTSGEPGDDSTSGAPLECPADIPEVSTPEALAETIAALTCAKAEACGCPDVPEDCVAQEIEFSLEYFKAHLDMGLVFDPACAGVFAFNEESVACDRDTPSPCPHCPWFQGGLPAGEACTVGPFGVDGCAGTLQCVLGRCAELVEVGAGEPCEEGPAGETIALCADGHFCRAATNVCTPYPALGEACVDNTCAPDAWCETNAGVCAPRLDDGSGCEESRQCLSQRCSDGVCETNSLACRLVAN